MEHESFKSDCLALRLVSRKIVLGQKTALDFNIF